MSLNLKYLEAIHYGKNKIFEDLNAPIWSSTSIHQMLMTDAYVKDIFNVLISDYCGVDYKGKFVKSNHDIKKLYNRTDNELHIINGWFKNFIILSKPTFHGDGEITLIRRYKKYPDYKPFVELVHDCLTIKIVDLKAPIDPKYLNQSPTGRSAVSANGSRVLERYQNLQKLNGG